MNDDLLQRHYEVRDRYVQAMGEADDDLLAPFLNPAFMGGPRWPSLRESWRRVRRGNNTLIVSDGLSDPFDDETEPNVGFGIEILVETPDLIDEPIQKSWLFDLAYDASQQAADTGAFRDLRDELTLFSVELYANDCFGSAVSPEGRVGVLFGLEPPDLDLEWELPAGLVRAVTAKLLFPSELALIIAEGRTGRERLRELFAAQGTHHLSSLNRPPVI